MIHATTHRIRFNDTDKLGHVNNAVFAVMLEQGRAELMTRCGLPVGQEGQAVVIVRLELDFLGELAWPGEVRIETGVQRLGNKSFTLDQALWSGDTLCGKARTVLVVMDRAGKKAVAIDRWRDQLEPWLTPTS